MNEKRFVVYDSDLESQRRPSATLQDRRRHRRFRVGVFAEIEAAGRDAIPSITYDMSRSGAQMLTVEPLEPGSKLDLSFISVDNDRVVTPCRVVYRSTIRPSMLWRERIGVEFISRAPSFFEAELEAKGQ